MKLDKPITVKEIADLIGARLIGDESVIVNGYNEIHKVTEGDLTFSDLEKYFERSLSSAASAIILNKEVESPEGKAILICDDPFEAYEKLIRIHRPFRPLRQSISESATIHPSVILEPGVVIGDHVTIAEGGFIQANTYIGHYTEIGKNVHIKPNSIVGSDAFYFKKYPNGFSKWTTCGRVIIGDDVYIGAACTIDCGVSGDTIIGDGTKLDSQIHVGHGVVIGKRCLMAAQVGIGGKTIIGDDVIIYGQAGIAQNLVIGNGAVILAKAGISKNLEGGKSYFGIPAAEAGEKYRELAMIKSMAKKK